MHAPQRVIRHPVPIELIDSIFERFEESQAALATQAAAYELGLALGMDTRVLAPCTLSYDSDPTHSSQSSLDIASAIFHGGATDGSLARRREFRYLSPPPKTTRSNR